MKIQLNVFCLLYLIFKYLLTAHKPGNPDTKGKHCVTHLMMRVESKSLNGTLVKKTANKTLTSYNSLKLNIVSIQHHAIENIKQ